MKMKSRALGVCAIGLATLTGAAQAERVDLLVFENADMGDVSQLDLWVDVAQVAGMVTFTFHNDSTVASEVTAIYIENSTLSSGLLSGASLMNMVGTNFAAGATPPNPPGSISGFGGSWGGNLFSADRNPGPGSNGINPGETLAVSFSVSDDNVDIADALRSGAFRMAQHVQEVEPGGFSVWTVTPAPGSLALLGLAGLTAAGRRRA